MFIFGKQKNGADLKNWYKDRYQFVLVQRNVLVLITLVCLGAVFMSNLAVSHLAPAKSVEPFVIQVEDKTGITEVVQPLSPQEITRNEALNEFFIVQYLRARESYEPGRSAEGQDIVRVMSEPQFVFKTYVRQRSTDNPDSPIVQLGNFARRTVKFKSITFISPQSAQVRLILEDYYFEDGKVVQQHKIALIDFEYIALQLTTEERYLNPLGFRVVNYRLDEDNIQR